MLFILQNLVTVILKKIPDIFVNLYVCEFIRLQ